jgi:ABC-type polysaccharide/polyol phosphate transport system ATPase subunit
VILEKVRVDFPIYGTERNLRKVLFDRATGGLIQRQGKNQDRVVVKALAGVSLTLQDGDRIGLIGHNGSGKSTLLKVIAGIYEPIEGRLLVEGPVMPLFDMMPGLDLEDSGYENIITTGLLLGLSRHEIESKVPEIEEFSELGEYIALPVRTYSTGMITRLGFALVTALEPGVLLMDEGIGAGDARFAERAEQRLNAFVGRSRIVVVASHSIELIRSVCNKAALMQAGQIVAIGNVDETYDRYDEIIHGATKSFARGAAAPPQLREEAPLIPAAAEGAAMQVHGAADCGAGRGDASGPALAEVVGENRLNMAGDIGWNVADPTRSAALEVATQPFAEAEGLSKFEIQDGRPLRWTDGAARIRVPILGSVPPSAVSVKVWNMGDPTPLTIRLNGACVFDGLLPPAGLQAVLMVPPMPNASHLVIEIGSRKFKPDGDSRWLGVALESVMLVRRVEIVSS